MRLGPFSRQRIGDLSFSSHTSFVLLLSKSKLLAYKRRARCVAYLVKDSPVAEYAFAASN